MDPGVPLLPVAVAEAAAVGGAVCEAEYDP